MPAAVNIPVQVNRDLPRWTLNSRKKLQARAAKRHMGAIARAAVHVPAPQEVARQADGRVALLSNMPRLEGKVIKTGDKKR
jgi:hypothetical protein